MGEMEITDCWSLLAVVKECSQLQAQRNTETNLTTSVTNASVGPLKTSYSAVNFKLPSAATPVAAQGFIPQDGPRVLHKLPRAQLNTETNLTTFATTASVGPLETNYSAINFMLPSATTFFPVQGNIPKDGPRNLHKLPRAQLNTETNLKFVTAASVSPLKTNYSAVNFMLPSAATPVAAQGSVLEDGPRNLHKMLRAQRNTETNLPTFATTASVGPLETNYSAVNFTLPLAATATPAVAQGSVSKNKSRYLHTQPLPPPHHPPPRVTNTLKTPMTKATTNLLVQQNPQQQPLRRNFSASRDLGSSSFGVDHHCYYKRKKFEEKRVMKWTLEELSTNDNWAWRKYGQKLVKGSPYPRNYYKCSSIKGCNARRQVERSSIDPYAYIVTYTSNHFHPPPPTRIYSKSRVKYSGSEMDPPPDSESPTETVPGQIGSGCESRPGTTAQGQIGTEYGSGSGGNAVKFDEAKRHDNSGGSLGSGVMYKKNKHKDREILKPKLMAGSDLLTGKEQLNGGEKITHPCNCSSRIARI